MYPRGFEPTTLVSTHSIQEVEVPSMLEFIGQNLNIAYFMVYFPIW